MDGFQNITWSEGCRLQLAGRRYVCGGVGWGDQQGSADCTYTQAQAQGCCPWLPHHTSSRDICVGQGRAGFWGLVEAECSLNLELFIRNTIFTSC